MKNLTLEQITAVCRGRYHGDAAFLKKEVDFITTDSRKAEKGGLFAAIVGTRADGHDFIPQVFEMGALAAVSERELPGAGGPYIQVDSTLQALKDIAEYYLRELDLPVVGITGSVGKTSTKEAVASVLSQKFCTLKTQGNFNNELGLPLTVFRLRKEHEIAVLEMGISDFGEMSRLGKIARPHTCIITNIGPCHLEFLGDRDGVLRAKTEIFDYLQEDGHILLNGDDDKLASIKESKGIAPVFFGMNPEFPVYADDVESLGLRGSRCTIHLDEEAFSVTIPIPGRHMVYNALAAAAAGWIYGLTIEQIRAGIQALEPVNGRFRLVETPKLLIVDDCYNANPVSMKASLDVLKDALGRKTAILGDMGELGQEEEALHREVGRYAAGCGLDLLLAAGTLSRSLAEAAKEENPGLSVMYWETAEELLAALPEWIRAGDTVLVKASHFMGFDRVVQALEEL